tara:strand:+ start:643 stop:933 length:291 start_codon:yes stop_codon:yes gene_type:complete
MKEVTFKLILECEDKVGVEDTLKKYLEKYLINAHSLEAIKLRIVAGDQLPPMGFDLFSMKLEKETKKEAPNATKKTTAKPRKSKKPVPSTVGSKRK